jgi:hypothetical protein
MGKCVLRVTRTKEIRNACEVLIRKREGNDQVRIPKRTWGIILKWFLKKKDMRVWVGLDWLRIVSSGGGL